MRKKIEPNMKNICDGQVFDNYKDLCDTLQLPVSNGKKKSIQLEDLKRYMSYEKVEGTKKYKVNTIYPVPLPEDIRNGSKYVNYISQILINKLAAQGTYMCRATKSALYEWLYMVDSQYVELKNKRKKPIDLSWGYNKNKKSSKSYEEMIEDAFFQNTSRHLDEVLMSALNSMANRRIITYSTEWVINRYCEETGKDEFFAATDDEVSKILEAERLALNKMGYKNVQGVFVSGKESEYYDIASAYIKKEYGWNYVYSHLKIICTPNAILQESLRVDKTLEDFYKEIADNGTALNNTLVKTMSAPDFFKNLSKRTKSPFDNETQIRLREIVKERILTNINPKAPLMGDITIREQKV